MDEPNKVDPITAEQEKGLTDSEYWKRIDAYSAQLIMAAKEQMGGTSLTWLDAFLSAASALAVVHSIPLDQLMARLAGNYIEVGGTLPKGLSQQLDTSFGNLKPPSKDLLN